MPSAPRRLRGSRAQGFQTLDAAAAAEIEALASRIVPSGDGPGARETGVIYFIDRALASFDADKSEAYRSGMVEVQKRRRELFPDSTSIAGLSNEQQIALVSTPCFRHAATTLFASSVELEYVKVTRAPAAANRSQRAAPIPRLPQ